MFIIRLVMLNNKYIRMGIKISIIMASFIFYYYSTTFLISYRKSNSVREVIFDAIDQNNDKLLSSKQIKNFAPCRTTYDKLNRKLARKEHRIDYSQFKKQVTDQLLKKTFAACSKNVPLYTNRSNIALMAIKQALSGYFTTYDLNQDDIITWKQYHTVNQFYKKRVKGERRTFQYIDKNQDWRITTTQFLTTKFYKLISPQGMQVVTSNKTLSEIVKDNMMIDGEFNQTLENPI